MIIAVMAMAVILGVVAYLVIGQLSTLDQDLADLHAVQDVKSHVLIPQKDMNTFLAAIDGTLLWLDLGNSEEAQATYDESVDDAQSRRLLAGALGHLRQVSAVSPVLVGLFPPAKIDKRPFLMDMVLDAANAAWQPEARPAAPRQMELWE